MADFRPTIATVDLAAFRHNLDEVRRRVGSPRGIMAVIKANAYGHGQAVLAREAVRWGAQVLGVATADEALELRETRGCEEIPIFVMAPTLPEDAETLQKAHIAVGVANLPTLEAHLKASRRLGAPAQVHIAIDTGMARFGFKPDELEWLDWLDRHPQSFEGLLTHFAVSDELGTDDIEFTDLQARRFAAVIREVHRRGHRPVIHAANSGAVLHHPALHYEMVRPGMMLYGANPDPNGDALPLKQVMTLSTRIAHVHAHPAGTPISYGGTWRTERDSRIGTLPIGYGDGFPRCLGNRMEVLVAGRRVPIRGRICMDQTMIDLTDVPEAVPGDEVVLYGSQGNERVSLEEVARLAGTIPYEITCQLGRRVPRRYINEGV